MSDPGLKVRFHAFVARVRIGLESITVFILFADTANDLFGWDFAKKKSHNVAQLRCCADSDQTKTKCVPFYALTFVQISRSFDPSFYRV